MAMFQKLHIISNRENEQKNTGEYLIASSGRRKWETKRELLASIESFSAAYFVALC